MMKALFATAILLLQAPGLALPSQQSGAIDNINKLEQFIDGAVNGQVADPKRWSKDLSVSLIDLNGAAKTDYESGIAYAVSATKIIPRRFSEVQEIFAKLGGIHRMVAAVKTHRNLVKISEDLHELKLKLSIRVPVLSDFETQAVIRVSDDGQKRGILEWRQFGTDGHLSFNRGAVIVEAMEEAVKVRVIGLHVIKPEHRIPWIGRLQAEAFTREHYANYISALESVLGESSRK